MFDLTKLLSIVDQQGRGPYGFDANEKLELYSHALGELTRHHFQKCASYRKIVESLGFDSTADSEPEAYPFLPVRLFKDYRLSSLESGATARVVTSSGTSGQRSSQIILDSQNASNQTKVLSRIVGDFIGKKRLPMLVLDTRSVLGRSGPISARGAGILGFSLHGLDVKYALTDKMRIDWAVVDEFCAKYSGDTCLLFGFTSIVWHNFCQELSRSGRKVSLDGGILIHGGGWKKLVHESVSSKRFKAVVREVSDITRVHNYYGMVEQTGSIFVECEKGFLHTSVFSDVVFRDANLVALPAGQTGAAQLLSLLPVSYPGHSILSEDLGEWIGIDDCSCGRLGRRFLIHGRIPTAEIRGCSDVIPS